jgi:hypothetical protein
MPNINLTAWPNYPPVQEYLLLTTQSFEQLHVIIWT